MMTLKFTLAFVGVDIDDFELLDRLIAVLPDVHWGEVDGEVQADVFSQHASFVEAVQTVNEAVRQEVPDARATRLVEDFVAVPDIATRTHVNRETVRLWSKESTFPRPRGVVGSGIKIWHWAAINTWLRNEHAGALGDAYRHPSPAEIAQVNTLVRQMEFHQLAVEKKFSARRHTAGHRWEEIPAVGFGGTTTLHVEIPDDSPVASLDAVAG